MVVAAVVALGAAPNAEDQLKALSEAEEPSGLEWVSPKAMDAAHLNGEEIQPMQVSMEFQDAPLKDVLKAFSQQTGINLIASQEVGDQLVTLYLEDVTVLDALDQILEAADLTYERKPGSQIYLVRPRTKEEEAGVVTVTRVYRLKFARVSQSRLARAAEALAEFVPQGIGEGTTGATGSVGLGGDEVGIDQVVRGLLTDVGQVEVDSRTNSLIVTDVEENFPRIESVLNALDIRTAQIVIEAELLETTLGKLKDLGFEWGTGTEADFVDFALGSRQTRFPWAPFGRVVPNISAASGKFTASTLDARDTIGILQALERDAETKILAKPRILTLDNERAVIQLTTDQAIGFTTTSTSTTGTTSVQPERTTTGVALVVTPQINEGGFITMLVEPSVTKTVAASVTPPATAGTVVDPKTRTARALVRVRDGETLVIGGLIDRSDQEILRRVPVLSGIPIIGKAFQNQEVDSTASELIVFVTPHIVAEPAGPQVVAGQGFALPPRAQEESPSRQELIERTLERLEGSPL